MIPFVTCIPSKVSSLCARLSLILAIFAGLLPSSLIAQITFEPNWVQLSPGTSPPARIFHAMAYDAAHRQVVLFGGGVPNDPPNPPTALNDTWVWDGSNWSQQNPATSPSARLAPSMAYDAARGKVVLFGGSNVSGGMNDTWEWDGTNWTQENPATSPPERDSSGMAYDAVHQQVVLFGGEFEGGYRTDTWVWNGTNWTQESPADNPPEFRTRTMAYDAAQQQVILFGGSSVGTPAINETWSWDGSNWTQESPANNPDQNDHQALVYDAAYGQVVLFGGIDHTFNFLNDTWLWNGTNWTQESPAASPQARIYHAMAYDARHGQVVLFSGENSGGALSDTWVWGGQGDFGSQAIGSSSTQTLNFSIAAGTTVGSIGVLTQGAPSLDFIDAGGNTCTATTYGSTTNCTVNVKFRPSVAGPRDGAVVFYSGSGLSGTQLGSVPISGIGTGPQIAYGPGTATAIDPTVSGEPLYGPGGLAVDAAGDLFIADYNHNRVVKVPAGGGAAIATDPTVGGEPLASPDGLSVDGAGDLFIADEEHSRVVEVPAGGGAAFAIDPTANGSGLGFALGVRADGAGNLFIADSSNNRVVEVPGSGGPPIAIAPTVNGNSLSDPLDVAVDGAGDLFIADSSNNRVVEVPAGAGPAIAINPTVNGNSLKSPHGVAVDGAGDLFIVDFGNSRVVEVPAGGGAAFAIDPTVNGKALTGPIALALDGAGDLFISDFYNNRVVEIQMSQPPSLSFATTVVGSTSGDSPQTAEIENIGNQALNFSGLSYPTDFPYAGSGVNPCTGSTSLSAGDECDVDIDFSPLSVGSPLSENVKLTDNNLNVTGAQQSIAVTGTGSAPPLSVTCSATNSGTVNVYFSSGPESVTGGVPGYTFYVGSGTVPNGLSLNTSTGAITGTPATSGAFSIAVKDSTNTVAATGCPFTIVAPPLVITWPTPAAINYPTPLSATQLDASANEPGTFAYNFAAGLILSVGSHPLTVTFTPTDTKDYSVTSVQVTILVNKGTPVIHWAPAPLQIGSKLGAAQLDATASVAGKFVYTPALGTEITTTTETLKVVFTPTNTTDYITASISVPLQVSVIKVSPTSINYGTVKLDSITTKEVTVSNLGPAAVSIYNPLVSIVKNGDSKEFLAENLCPKSLAAHTSCTIKVVFVAGPYYHQQSATLSVIDSSPGSPQMVSLTALTKEP